MESNELPAQIGAERRLTAIALPELLQRNDPNVIKLGVENTGEILFRALAERLGRTDLAGLDLLDIGCGVRFTQTLVNRDVPFASYTGIDVWPTLVTWLQENVEKQDDRFHFSCWNVYNAMYNKAASPMESYQDLPVSGSYDVILGYSLFTHLDPGDTSAILRLARKVVRADGRFLLTAFCDEAIPDFEDRVPDRPLLNAYYNPAYLQKLIEEAGWKVLSSRPPYDFMQHSWLCQPVTLV